MIDALRAREADSSSTSNLYSDLSIGYQQSAEENTVLQYLIRDVFSLSLARVVAKAPQVDPPEAGVDLYQY